MGSKYQVVFSWTVFIVCMSSWIGGFISFADDSSVEKAESASVKKKNETAVTPSNDVIVEVTNSMEDEEDATTSVVNAVFSHSIAPATPELLLIPSSVMQMASVISMLPPVNPSASIIPKQSAKAEINHLENENTIEIEGNTFSYESLTGASEENHDKEEAVIEDEEKRLPHDQEETNCDDANSKIAEDDDSAKTTDIEKKSENEVDEKPRLDNPTVGDDKVIATKNENEELKSHGVGKSPFDAVVDGKSESKNGVVYSNESETIPPSDKKEKEDSEGGEKSKDSGMLSFTEWKKKLDLKKEREKEEEDVVDISKLVSQKNKTVLKKTNKIKKNYASLECGAKVISANEEATNIISVLKEDKDAYMLNPCNVKAWFIVELCERIELHSIDFANFEMFSSTPESFVVHVSSRYPTREWEVAGKFQGKPEKNVHTYTFEERFYAKYIKIEIKKYFGKEHYCPLSLLRVFGITEVEQIEDEDEHEQSTDDASNTDETQQQTEKTDNDNIFTTAKKAVVGLVSGMAKKLSGQPEDDTVLKVNKTNEDGKLPVVTLLPDSNVDFDENYFINGVPQKQLAHLNKSANPNCSLWFNFVLCKHMCPTLNLQLHNVSRYVKKHRTKKSYKRFIKETKTESRIDSIIVSSSETLLDSSEILVEENSVPPLPVPPLAVTESMEVSVAFKSSASSSSVVEKTTSVYKAVNIESKNDIATTQKSKVDKQMCSKETMSLDVRSVVPPNLQPSYGVDITTALSLATQSLDAVQIESKMDKKTTSSETSTKLFFITSTSSLKSVEKTQESVDVLEFKVNDTVQGGIVAEKILENETISRAQSHTTSTTDILNTLEMETNEESIEITETDSSQKYASSDSTTARQNKTDAVDVSSSSFSVNSPSEQSLESLTASSTEMLPSVLNTTPPNTETPFNISPSPSRQVMFSIVQTTESDIVTVSTTESVSIESEAVITENTIVSSTTQVKNPTGLSGSKESIIVKLNAKVKALQANLTMSMMYLEEMSERYRAAVEEVDKRHEKKSFALNVSLKSHQDMIELQAALISNLTKKVGELTQQILDLTNVTQHQHTKLSETQFTWMFLEIVIMLMVVLLCRRAPAQERVEENRRRYSEPAMNYKHTNGTLKRPYLSSSTGSIAMNGTVPHVNTQQSSPTHVLSTCNGTVNCPSKRKRRKKSRGLDKQIFSQDEEAKVSKSAGLLFSAGNKLISGITGAFCMHKVPSEKPSLQASALLDGIPTQNGSKPFTKSENHVDCGSKSFAKSKSFDLHTIEEIDMHGNLSRFYSSDILNIKSKKNSRNKVHKSGIGRFGSLN
ncbi:SUN domain-containing ossification factor-like [Hydractinia symbiolongicarpus]|uniref:SUN domain-containing ossification factor-like n=1 Tax=Hydractinia symbiolongicarpus TaxID=13093 RepID=UPI002551476B|nr:SUN domain-containing ossification factor-like [Hydractinia symbiolongicarpus]